MKDIIRIRIFFLSGFILTIMLANISLLYGQTSASPSNWIYPDGNLAATKYNRHRSEVSQSIDSMQMKWFSPSIRGDVQPLIGNIVHNSPIILNSPYFRYAPNEIAAVVGDTLVILDGSGKVLSMFCVSHGEQVGNDIVSISALLDTSSSLESPESSARTLILGFESLEARRDDSLAITYIGGWNHTENKFQYLRRLALNLKMDQKTERYYDYLPNYSASIKPIYARKRYFPDYAYEDPDGTSGSYYEDGSETPGYMIYATVNMDQPANNRDVDGDGIVDRPRPYFRGLTAFNLHHSNITFPLPDVGDYYEYRVHFGPQVGFSQPSIGYQIDEEFGDTLNNILLPCMPSPVASSDNNADSIDNSQLENIVTWPYEAYLINLTMNKDGVISEGNGAYQLSAEVENKRPRVRPYFVELTDANVGYPVTFILATTEYNGTANSSGRSGLFLFDHDGIELYNYWSSDEEQELLPFLANHNHYWSIGVGNMDGRSSNSWQDYYPNNPGNEIIATQSSRNFAYANNKLMVFRYNSSPFLTPKASPPGTSLRNFDTICTHPIQGWLAAVNDLDGTDSKDEVLLVSGSRIFVLRMNDYSSTKFLSGKCFDTIYTYKYNNETITSASISDVDGDGRNDIIVTTNAGIYVTGTPLERTIDLITLSDGIEPYQADWCFGDSVKVQWKNIIQGNSFVNIAFKELTADTLVYLKENQANGNDTADFSFLVDSSLAGKEGYILVQSVNNPVKNCDTSGLLRFHRPSITTNVGTLDTLFVGTEFTIKGTVFCADSAKLYYSFDAITWEYVASAVLDSTENYGTFNYEITTTLPCLPIFDCLTNQLDTTIYGRVIFSRNQSVDSTNIFPIVVKPVNFPLTISPCEQMCPTREVTWEVLDSTLLEGTMDVLLSTDTGKTFIPIDIVPIASKRYLWNVPTNVTTPVILRFCADEYCFKSDTMLWNYMPKYIKTVAPNPFKIPLEAEIVYQIDEDTEASMYIIDQSNRYVKTIIKNAPRRGGVAYCERWNGRLDDDTPVSNGMYYIMLELSNGITEIYPLYIRN